MTYINPDTGEPYPHPGIYCKTVVLDYLRDFLLEGWQYARMDSLAIMEKAAHDVISKVCQLYKIRETFYVRLTEDKCYSSIVYIDIGPDTFLEKLDLTIAAKIRKELEENVFRTYRTGFGFTKEALL